MQESPEHIAVVDPFATGHHLAWATEFCASLLREGKSVVAVFPKRDALTHALNDLVPEHMGRFSTVDSTPFASGDLPKDRVGRARTALERWRRLDSLLNGLKRRPDHVYFAYLDAMLAPGLPPLAVDSVFSFQWSGLYLHPIWTRMGRRLPMQMREGWCLRSRRCRGVALLDEGLIPRFQNMLPRKRVCQVPDFLSSNTEQSIGKPHPEILARAAGRPVIGLIGTLQSRKGLSTLLRAALDPRSEKFYFVMAGELKRDNFNAEELALIDQALAGTPKNCFFHPHAIPCERTFVAVAQSCDILYAAYRDFPHSSNILALASLLRKPVVVSDGYLMGERARRYNLGEVVPQSDVAATLRALETLATETRSATKPERAYSAYLHTHSRDRLAQSLRTLIDGHDKAESNNPKTSRSIPAA